jgi:hypothetical protein
VTLLTELDAFYLEHRRCDELEAGVDGPVVWMACVCGARIAREGQRGRRVRAVDVRLTVLTVVVLLLAGCVSSGLIGPLPTLTDADNAAEIVVGRENRFAGSALTLPVTLDGVRVYGLRVGEHAVMKVNPGDHVVGTQNQGITFAWEDVTVLVRAEPRRNYYFRLDPAFGHVLMNAITPEAGRVLMSKTRRVSGPSD